MYYSSGEEAILVVIGSSRYLSVCQRVVWMNLGSLRFGMRYSVRGIAICNNVICNRVGLKNPGVTPVPISKSIYPRAKTAVSNFQPFCDSDM